LDFLANCLCHGKAQLAQQPPRRQIILEATAKDGTASIRGGSACKPPERATATAGWTSALGPITHAASLFFNT